MKIGDFGLSKTMADTHPEGVPWFGPVDFGMPGKLSELPFWEFFVGGW